MPANHYTKCSSGRTKVGKFLYILGCFESFLGDPERYTPFLWKRIETDREPQTGMANPDGGCISVGPGGGTESRFT